MEQPIDAGFNVTLENIWEESPLARDEVAAIITAPGLPITVSEPLPGAASATLALISIFIFNPGINYPNASASLIRRLRKTHEHFQALLDEASFTAYPPPEIPDEFNNQLTEWIKSHSASARRGYPEINSNKIIYPLLLGFFELAYGLKPMLTRGGATVIFLKAFHEATWRRMSTSKWLEDQPQSRPLTSHNFQVPGDDAFIERIRKFRSDGSLLAIRDTMVRLCNGECYIPIEYSSQFDRAESA